jgi:DNA polymerase-3 subunit epsilon
MNLPLQKPLVFFDLETTGVNISSDQIIDLCIVKLQPGMAEKQVKTFRFNPGIPIPAGATKVHGITNKDVAHCPRLEDHAEEIISLFRGCDIGGFNVMGFDLPFLSQKLKERGHRLNLENTLVVDPMVIFHNKQARNLASAYEYYCGRSFDNAHSAEADTLASLEVFERQMQLYPELGSVDQAAAFCTEARGNFVDQGRKLKKNEKGDLVYAFGKHIGKKVTDELDYASWMIKADFEEDTKMHLRRVIEESRR